MSKPEIKQRKDVRRLVELFYAEIRKDELLGPIFNGVITDWETHEEHITDFWEGNLLWTKSYSGDPLGAHAKVDAHMNHTMDSSHFGHWLNIWFDTVDSNFSGEVAQRAKRQARKMSTFLYLHVFQARKKFSDS